MESTRPLIIQNLIHVLMKGVFAKHLQVPSAVLGIGITPAGVGGSVAAFWKLTC